MAGTNTASLLYAGAAPPLVAVTELWNGSSWTEVNDLNTARKLGSYFGATNTAAIYATGNSTAVESWNGTSWSEVAEINTNGVKRSGFGTQTSGLIAGGEQTPPGAVIDSTEVWNGSAWTEVNNLNTARQGAQSSSGTNSTVGLYFGGSDPGALTGKTELWNGTSWSEQNDMAVAAAETLGAGSGMSAIRGSQNSPVSGASEHWTVPFVEVDFDTD